MPTGSKWCSSTSTSCAHLFIMQSRTGGRRQGRLTEGWEGPWKSQHVFFTGSKNLLASMISIIPTFPVSVAVWVNSGAGPGRLYLLMLRTHKRADGVHRQGALILLCNTVCASSTEFSSASSAFPHVSISSTLMATRERSVRECRGGSRRGCLRTSYLMQFSPTLNGTRSLPWGLHQLAVIYQLSAAFRCL